MQPFQPRIQEIRILVNIQQVLQTYFGLFNGSDILLPPTFYEDSDKTEVLGQQTKSPESQPRFPGSLANTVFFQCFFFFSFVGRLEKSFKIRKLGKHHLNQVEINSNCSKTNQHHVASETMHRESYSISSGIFLPKMHNLTPIIRKHQTNPN